MVSDFHKPVIGAADYLRIFEISQEGIWIVNSEAVTTYVNSRMAEMLGYSVDGMLGRSLFDFFDAETGMRVRKNFETRKKGFSEVYDLCFLRKDGSSIFTILSVSPLMDDEGRFAGSVGMITDITERKKAEEALKESEERLKTLSNLGLEGIVIHDKGLIVEANLALARIFGYEPKELIGRSGFVLLTPESQQVLAETLRTGSEEPYELVGIKKDGAHFPLEIRGKNSTWKGKPVRVGIIRDITRRKRIEDELKESMRRLSEAHRIAHLGSWELDFEHEELKFSDEAHLIFGLSPGEITFKNFMSFIHPDDRAGVESGFSRAFSGHESYRLDHRIFRKDGSIAFVNCQGEVLSDGKGKPLRMLGTVMDISERKKAEAMISDYTTRLEKEVEERTVELKAEKEKVEALAAIKDEFIRNITHELKTPLSAIIMGLSFTKDNRISDGMLDLLGRNADRLSRSIDQILQLSKLEHTEVRSSNVGLRGIIEDIYRENLPLARLRRLDLVIDADDVSVLGNANLLRLAVNNLVSNSLKFTKSGGIEIRLKETDGDVHLSVSDTGVGISESDQKRLFERFFKADPSAPGTGMGLTIVKSVIEKHKGKIAYKSELGKGSIFEITLPKKVENGKDLYH